jgi:hypothetical protein
MSEGEKLQALTLGNIGHDCGGMVQGRLTAAKFLLDMANLTKMRVGRPGKRNRILLICDESSVVLEFPRRSNEFKLFIFCQSKVEIAHERQSIVCTGCQLDGSLADRPDQ